MINRTEADIMKNWDQSLIDSPVVSIKCLTYNHEKYIEQCLDGFLMQETAFPFEIVIHDDASTDSTADIIRRYEERYPNILKPIYETENQYSKKDGSLRRIINKHIRGAYIALCEGDDYWIDSQKLQKQVCFLENNPDYSMVFNAAYYVDGDTIICDDKKSDIEKDFTVSEMIRGGGSFCATASLCYRREGMNVTFEYQKPPGAGDYRLQIAMALIGKVHYFPEIMTAYRRGTSNSNSWTNRVLANPQRRTQHWRNEISWLRILNEETNNAYAADVHYRIFWIISNIYKSGDANIKELFKAVTKLDAADKKNAIIMICRDLLQKKCSPVYNILRYAKCAYKRIKNI